MTSLNLSSKTKLILLIVGLVLVLGGGFALSKFTMGQNFSSSAHASEGEALQVIKASADSFVDASKPTANYGTKDTLQVDKEPNVNAYIKFPLSFNTSVPVIRATLRLYTVNPSKFSQQVYTTDATWEESSITYANAPKITGAPVATFDGKDRNTWVEIDVTNSLKNLQSNMVSFAIVDTKEDGFDFASKEKSQYEPQLLIYNKEGLTPVVTPFLSPTAVPGPSGSQPSVAPSVKPSGVQPSGVVPTTVLPTTAFPTTAVPSTVPVVSPITTSGKLYYVSNSGADTNPGTITAPFKTIQKAAGIVAAGDVVVIKSGTYKEAVSISGKKGTPTAPIVFVGESADQTQYPVIDGGDIGFNAGSPTVFTVSNSDWIVFERLKTQNSSNATFLLSNTSYITVRRNVMVIHKYGVQATNKANHTLMEYNDCSQAYQRGLPWTSLKNSKWEGGCYTSFGGGDVAEIRYNYIHDSFNGIYMGKGSRTYQFADANVWVHHNRFERIVDDPFEPETYGVNDHFYNNTLIDTHRLVSLAPIYLGPVYIYNNAQVLRYDITGEAASLGRQNASFKMRMDVDPTGGVWIFNNSIDMNTKGINGSGVDMLIAPLYSFHHLNNAYRTENSYNPVTKTGIVKKMFNGTPQVSANSTVDFDVSMNPIGYTEAHGIQADPGFTDTAHENFMLSATAAARGKSTAVTITTGFSSPNVIAAGDDVGAYRYGSTTARSVPAPARVVPPGCSTDPTCNTTQYAWPPDSRGGVNPPSGPLK